MPNNPPRIKPNRYNRCKYSESKDDIIYSAQWKKLRAQYLELNPICERCLYLNELTYESATKLSVHHIYRRNRYPEMAFDEENLLTLCDACHHNYFDELEAKEPQKAIEEGLAIKNWQKGVGGVKKNR